MALPTINLTGGNLPPEILGQQQQLNRQQQMAQMLMQQGQQTPQGQMISGRYVAPSFTQNLASLANAYVGSRLAEKGDKQALELAAQLRQRYGDELKEFRNLMQGRETLAPEQAGPTQTGQPIPQEMVRGAPNVQGAYDFAAGAYNPALQAVGIKKLTPEEFTLAEGAKRYMTMPDGTVKEVAAGGQKPRAPLQIDTGTAIELRDPANPTIVLSRIPKYIRTAFCRSLATRLANVPMARSFRSRITRRPRGTRGGCVGRQCGRPQIGLQQSVESAMCIGHNDRR